MSQCAYGAGGHVPDRCVCVLYRQVSMYLCGSCKSVALNLPGNFLLHLQDKLNHDSLAGL